MNQKKKEIIVEKEFLDMILNKITELENKINEKPEETKTHLPIIINDNYLFQCHALAPHIVLPEKQLEFNMKVNEFGKELEILMKKYNFIRSTGEFFAKNIN